LARYPALDVVYRPDPQNGALHDWLYAELDAFEPIAIEDLPDGGGWRVFFRAGSQRDDARTALSPAVGERLIALSPAEIDDEDWARRSQAALGAIRAGRITVAPPWDIPQRPGSSNSSLSRSEHGRPSPESRVPNPDLVIVIEPSMGFGTGHHATTRLCLELLQTLDVTGKCVIDVGTGSGVLAIAASSLGAERVTAVDNDPDALQNARDNIVRNFPTHGDTGLDGKVLNQTPGRHGSDIEVIEADLSAFARPEADIVLANLTGAVLQRHAAALGRIVRPGGVLIVSGFSPDEIDDVVGALALPVVETRIDGEWAAALLGGPAGRRV
jgi:ribosomal protein L11 methyltransferase